MASELTYGVTATMPISLIAEVEKFAETNGYMDKNGPIRGTAVTVLVAQALGFDLPKPASKLESDADRKAREAAALKAKNEAAKAALAALRNQNREAATAALAVESAPNGEAEPAGKR